MRIENINNSYALQFDENNEIKEGIYCGEGTSIISNDTSIKINAFTTNEVDWIINHAAENGIPEDLLQLEMEPRSENSDLAVNKLVSLGKIIITVDENN